MTKHAVDIAAGACPEKLRDRSQVLVDLDERELIGLRVMSLDTYKYRVLWLPISEDPQRFATACAAKWHELEDDE